LNHVIQFETDGTKPGYSGDSKDSKLDGLAPPSSSLSTLGEGNHAKISKGFPIPDFGINDPPSKIRDSCIPT
jgi:hypothetical protein